MSDHKCPICNGRGTLDAPRHGNDLAGKKIMARALHQSGYSLRQIAALVGWKSPRSVVEALRSKIPTDVAHQEQGRVARKRKRR
mgnify:CR=1 FL=1